MPNKNCEVSVFRISDVTDAEIWVIGECEVVPKRGKPIKGRADILTSDIQKHGLSVVPKEPPPKHANIIHWKDTKEANQAIAIELAAAATFVKLE